MTQYNLKYFGQNVKGYREIYGWLPFQLARECRVGVKELAAVENGEVPSHLLAYRLANAFNVDLEELINPPESKKRKYSVEKKELETIDFDSIDKKLRDDFTKTVCILREIGFILGEGNKYGAHSVEIPPLTLNISYCPKRIGQKIDLSTAEDDLLDYFLNSADGDIIDHILNRKHRVPLGKNLKKVIKEYTENRNKKLGDLSWVDLNE